MADLEERGSRPFIRSIARNGVRAGMSQGQILSRIEDEFPFVPTASIRRVIRQEAQRDRAITSIMRRPLRDRTNLHAIVGCGRGERVQARITISYPDPNTGRQRTFGHTTTLASTGRMMDILNAALREAVNDAAGRGYVVPRVTSSMTGGSVHYRIEYVECV